MIRAALSHPSPVAIPARPFPSRAHAQARLREAPEGERRVRAAMVRLHLAKLRAAAIDHSRSAIMAKEEDKSSIAAQELRLGGAARRLL